MGTLKSNLYNCKACDKSCNINKEKLCAKGGKSFNFFFGGAGVCFSFKCLLPNFIEKYLDLKNAKNK